MSDQCLFCRTPLEDPVAVEHIIPESIGGWLTTRDICTPCNSRFGHQVDRVTGEQPLVSLRLEAGLPIGSPERPTFFDSSVRERVPGRVRPDGSVEALKRVFDDGTRFIVQAPTIQEARSQFAKYSRRQAAQGRNAKIQGEQTVESKEVVVRYGGMETTKVQSLLLREAAKSAIEYIARECGPAVALDQSLNDIRSFALCGEPPIRAWIQHYGGKSIYLPRTGRLFTAVGDDEVAPTEEDREALLKSLPQELTRLTDLFHRLTLLKEGFKAQFQLILFGWIGVIVELPGELPIPAGVGDFFDFNTGEPGRLERLTRSVAVRRWGARTTATGGPNAGGTDRP